MATYTIEESTLTGIADAIRAKNGSEDLYTSSEMAEAIEALEAANPDCNGLHIPESALVISGDCQHMFSQNKWYWFIERFGDKVVTVDVENAQNMFYFTDKLEEIPFDINLKNGKNPSCQSVFQYCTKLKSVPYIKGAPNNITSLFENCRMIRSIPEDWGDYLDFSYLSAYIYGNLSAVFYNCHSLRSLPKSLLSKLHGKATTSSYSPYARLLSGCYVLDEVKDIPIQDAALTSNTFSDTFYRCFRVKDITFETQEDGSPYVCQWKNQTIDLTSGVGYTLGGQKNYIYIYNSGITNDKEVKDDATYKALKDDVDWFTEDIAYSRYNHESAVNTINSLPDVSSGSGNTIKFKGEAGEKKVLDRVGNLIKENKS